MTLCGRLYGFSRLIQFASTMLLRAPAIVSPATDASSPWKHQQGSGFRKGFSADKCSVGLFATSMKTKRGAKHSVYTVRAVAGEWKTAVALNGVVFEPFAEVQNELVQVSQSFSESLARQKFTDSCEGALNEQINVEYNVSYIYHALFAYFDRDNVGLPGFAKYFKDASDEERGHAEMLMKYQNIRGGKVKLQSILMPTIMDFDNAEKGEALYAMELALSLEKLTNQKLLNLHTVAQEANDGQMTDFIEGNFLTQQVEAIKIVSEYVSQLRRMGKGHAVWHFDQMLLNLNGGDVAPAPNAGVLAPNAGVLAA